MSARRPNAPLTPPMGPSNAGFTPPGSFTATPPPQQLPTPGVPVGHPTEVATDGPTPEIMHNPDAVSLTPEEMASFSSLLTCGRRTKTVTIFNHVVVVKSLCGDDDLRIGLYTKDYQGSFGEQRAFQIAVAAAGLCTIDGQPLVNSLAPGSEDVMFDEKVKKVGAMYPTVINKIYRAVMDAEAEFIELAERLGK